MSIGLRLGRGWVESVNPFSSMFSVASPKLVYGHTDKGGLNVVSATKKTI